MRHTAKKAKGDSFQVYSGEFLISPIPVELSFNWCSHNCLYCFSNLAKPERWADTQKTLRFLAKYQERNSLEAKYLQWGLPTLISNRVDPFANTNEAQALPVLELMTALELPMAFQTKGGRSLDSALDFLPPSAWYISIAHNDDSTASKIEPGAPTIKERLDLCDKLRSLGHKVNVGLNPAVPEWLPRPEELIKAFSEHGVHGVWIEIMHLSNEQIANISDRGRSLLTEPLIQRAKSNKNKVRQGDKDFALRLSELCREYGMHPYTMNQHEATGFWGEYYDVYPALFPTLADLVNDCHEVLEDGDFLTRDDYLEYFLPQLPEGRHSTGQYIASRSRAAMKKIGKAEFSNNLTFEELLCYSWDIPEISFSPANLFAFAYATQGDELIVDEKGCPVMVFCPNGTDQYVREVG